MRVWLTRLVLALLHAVYWLWTLCISLHSHLRAKPAPLSHPRTKLPNHLALALVTSSRTLDAETTETALLESVIRATSWCRVAGIQRLTVYDREGILSRLADLREHLTEHLGTSASGTRVREHKIQFPLTPPASDDGGSRSSSPDGSSARPELDVVAMQFPSSAKALLPPTCTSAVKRRRSKRKSFDTKPFVLHVISRQSAKPAIARTAIALARSTKAGSPSTFAEEDRALAQNELNLLLEGQSGFPSPDLMLVHDISRRRLRKQPLELHGFPPWQMRLTEFYFDGRIRIAPSVRPGASARALPLEEIEFRRALDEFAAAEMRLGK